MLRTRRHERNPEKRTLVALGVAGALLLLMVAHRRRPEDPNNPRLRPFTALQPSTTTVTATVTPPVTTVTAPAPTGRLLGDVDGDGTVSLNDSALILHIVAGLAQATPEQL